ncbi:uncharacterized protein LOC121411159 isoform X2 [Lytechinus variegatus]|uniref:uncharacterized protein LOC121411159 isoform X2 n=1 Tax=Lytechinus variegatus TaxID=7654 RepID=UPI001BB1D529|nr:uncharacterized protein LOC121411159 isoform X2 [Lytechinus variegatus]
MMGVSGSKKNQSNLAAKNQRNTHHRYVDPIYQNTKLLFNADDGTDFGEVLITQPKKAAFHPLEVENIDDLDDVEFPYENIVFEGGGCQGNAYIGAVKELDRLGHLKKLRRFGGASIGAVTACLISMGHSADSVLEELKSAPKIPQFLDAGCGSCSLVPNTIRYFGWHPGKVSYEWFGRFIENKLGNPDATFRDLYEKVGNELCIVVTNLSLKMEEYCHVKTTPNLPIRAALRMSTSLPGVFYPFQKVTGDRTDLYIDGGLICNYPVHCFDGWWLSMKPEDTFLKRMQPLTDVGKLMMKKERFGTFNEKTIGLIIFSDYDQHVLSANPDLIARPSFIPDTDLGREYKKVISKREYDIQRHTVVTEAMSKFLRVLNEHNLDGNDTINRSEFEQALTKTDEFTTAHRRALFGSHLTSPSEIFSALDISGDGEIDFHEMMMMAESRGAGIESQIIGAGWTKISKASNIVDCVFRTLLMNVKRAFLEGGDNERTVMINTAYIKSMDFDMKQEDTDFLIEQGRQGIRSFLRYQMKKKQQQKVERINVEESNIQTM